MTILWPLFLRETLFWGLKNFSPSAMDSYIFPHAMECNCSGLPFLDAFHLVEEACPYKAERAWLWVLQTWVQVPFPGWLCTSLSLSFQSVKWGEKGEKKTELSAQRWGFSNIKSVMYWPTRGAWHKLLSPLIRWCLWSWHSGCHLSEAHTCWKDKILPVVRKGGNLKKNFF